MRWAAPLLGGTLLVLIAVTSHWDFRLNAYQAALCLAALGLDFLAVSLPYGGTYSCAWVPLLALANATHDGGGIALLPALLGVALRRGRAGPGGEDLALVGLAGGFLCANLWQSPLLGCASGILFLHLVERLWARRRARERLAGDELENWARLQNTLHETYGPLVLACLTLTQAAPLKGWVLGLLLPLVGSQRAVAHAIFRLQARAAQQALQRLQALQLELERSYRNQEAHQRELDLSQSERAWMESLSQVIGDESAPLERVLQLFAQRLPGFHSWALLQGQESWKVRASLGPQLNPERLSESLVADCWRVASPRLLSEPTQVVVAAQTTAVALPLGPLVLYAGRAGAALGMAEGNLLISLARQAAPLLTPRLENLQLQRRVSCLTQLQQASQQLSVLPEESSMLAALPQLCQLLAPAAAGRLWLEPGQPRHSWGQLPPPSGDALQACVASARAVCQGSRLFLPLGDRRGVLELETEAGPEQVEALGLLAQHLGLALSGAQHQQARVQVSKMNAIAQLAAGVAHELNTPMGAISLSLEGLTSSLEEAGVRRKLERATRALERCRSIVSRLMIYTRLSPPEGPPIDLSSLARDTLELFRVPLELERFQLETHWTESLTVKAQAQELQQLLVNLLRNALEASSPSGWVGVRTLRSGPWAVLEVVDRGCGMEPEQLARAADPFFTTKRIGENLGLGLTVSQELARHYGGDIELRSQPDQGTSVTVRLPLSPG